MSGSFAGLIDRLPHRPPFRFITEVLMLEPGLRGRATWHILGTEEFLAGHFPGNPIVPGVLITEALAQLSGLVAAGKEAKLDGRLAQVDVRFGSPVIPPACLELQSSVQRSLGRLVLCEVEARCSGQSCARGTLTLAVTS